MDYGERYTEKKISAVNRELRKTYRTAQAELKKKLADFEKRFAEKNKQKKQELDEGKISKQDYKDWLTGQVFIRNQWQANIRQVCKVMHDANRQAINIVNNSRFDVFAENYNYNAWKAERDIAVSFNVYSAEAVAQLMTDDPQLLPEWKIDEEKDYTWNYNRVNNIVRQGIIQGEGIPEITDRLCSALATSNDAKMRMFARTALGAAQSAGRQKQMEDAAAMGIEVHKRWIAAHDSRTRDAHRDLDGREVPYNQPFKSELGDIRYPKDPTAKAANVFNCRCSMVTIYPKYEDYSKKYGEGEIIDGQTYEEWKKGKKARGEVQPEKPTEKPKESTPTIAGVAKGAPMTHKEADTGRVNPNFAKEMAYRINCQSCVVTYEARMRGYDVEVLPRDGKHPTMDSLASDSRIAWKNKDGSAVNFMIGGGNEWRSRATFGEETPTAKRFEKKLHEQLSDDGRYTLEFRWKGRGAGSHIVILEKDVDDLIIYDPQPNRLYRGKQVSDYLNQFAYSIQRGGNTYYRYPGVTRIDDKEINFDVANEIMQKRDER